MRFALMSAVAVCLLAGAGLVCAQSPERLPSTKALTWTGDIASRMIDGIDRFLLSKLDESAASRDEYWRNHQSETGLAQARRDLAHILGLRDERVSPARVELVTTTSEASTLATVDGVRVQRIRWSAVDQINGEGLLLEPSGQVIANVVAIPDTEQSPEQFVAEGYPLRLAISGCRVVVPALVSRQIQKRRSSELTDREYLYRTSFELGRQLTGYELQKVLSIVDWFAADDRSSSSKTGVVGWGEGGRLALYAGALDARVHSICVSGYFGDRTDMWQEPIDRNVFGLLNAFGDAELVGMKRSGSVVIDASDGPISEVTTRGGAPYRLTKTQWKTEVRRLRKDANVEVVHSNESDRVSDAALSAFAKSLGCELRGDKKTLPLVTDESRSKRQITEIEAFNERLLIRSPYVRNEFFKNLNTKNVESHEKTVESYRDFFRENVIGHFDDALLPMNPRSRRVFESDKWTAYEVVLDVFDDVFAFGILLLPKDLQTGEKRPVVVCQHGLEGRPRNVIQGDHGAYHDYAAKLAERGFITFSPQNIYIFRDRFRTLQRKANPIGKTLFSVMVPQHQQIVNWLSTLSYVDPDRIAFYGLSYGGKSAMRIPPLVPEYCLSICSADFNDWVWKNASTVSRYSYVWTGEYEIFEWDLGSTFNYAEMAALIAPRPFMVERGHFDGVAPDERVALEFAKVRHLYQAKLGIGDRCEIEFFVGPHTINGKGTFEFLHRHLNWPQP